MLNAEYEIVIVGGGPAGLGAARTAARLGFRTLLLERLPRIGESAHPSGGVLAPIPGLISAEREAEEIYFPEVDLRLPASFILGYPTRQPFASSLGYQLGADSTSDDGNLPVAVVDPASLLRLLAEQADHAGAELSYGAAVTGLWQEGDRVCGVRTTRGDTRAALVLAAEGAARQLADEAGLYSQNPASRRYAFLVSQHMEAPAVRREDLGQIVTLGHRYTSAPEAFGTVVMATPGRASVYFTVLADRAKDVTVQSCWSYLDEYLENDPRVHDLLAGARILGRSGQRVELRDAPQRLLRDGFIGVGDAIAPTGRLGILAAIYSGRQAALVAAEAVDAGDTSAAALSGYGAVMREVIESTVEAEHRLIRSLTGMRDNEITRLVQTLQTLRLSTPFFDNWRAIAWDMIGSLGRNPLPIAGDPNVVHQASALVNSNTGERNELFPVPMGGLATHALESLDTAGGVRPVPFRVRVLD